MRKKRKILILEPEIKYFEPIDKACSPWITRKSGVDRSIAQYINSKYAHKGISADFKNPYKADVSKYDMIYSGLEYWGYAHILKNKSKYDELQFKKFLQKIPAKKLYLPKAYLDFGYDKCKLFSSLSKFVRMAPTKCLSISKVTVPKILKLARKWGTIFLKPIPGEESVDLFKYNVYEDAQELKNYITHLKKQPYDKLVIQKFMSQFATEAHPECRTFWIGHKYQLGVKTMESEGQLGGGDYMGNIHRLNPYIKKKSLEIIKYLEKRFRFKFVMARLDWGYDKKLGGYFFNEIEITPGIFNSEMDEEYGRCTWTLDSKIGDRLVQILEEKYPQIKNRKNKKSINKMPRKSRRKSRSRRRKSKRNSRAYRSREKSYRRRKSRYSMQGRLAKWQRYLDDDDDEDDYEVEIIGTPSRRVKVGPTDEERADKKMHDIESRKRAFAARMARARAKRRAIDDEYFTEDAHNKRKYESALKSINDEIRYIRTFCKRRPRTGCIRANLKNLRTLQEKIAALKRCSPIDPHSYYEFDPECKKVVDKVNRFIRDLRRWKREKNSARAKKQRVKKKRVKKKRTKKKPAR